MSQIQEIFNKIQETKKQQKDIKATNRDALSNSQELKDITEKIQTLKEQKKGIEDAIKSEFSSEFEKLDSLKLDIESNNIILSDLALNEVVKGEMIEITAQYSNKYEPIFSVKFKKLG